MIGAGTNRTVTMNLWADLHNHRGRLLHKWTQYFPAYERHFARFRNQAVSVLEIGVGDGGSLQMWRRFFGPYARLMGVDIDPKCKAFEDYNTAVRIGDQSDPAFLNAIMDELGPVQIIIDDGSHRMDHVRRSFELLYHHRQFDPNGVYVVEDLHTAYWPEFGGGLRRPDSFIEIAKAQVDELNAQHTRGALPPTPFTGATLSMHFYDSMVFYERGRRPPNVSMMADAEGIRQVQIIFNRRAGSD